MRFAHAAFLARKSAAQLWANFENVEVISTHDLAPDNVVAFPGTEGYLNHSLSGKLNG